MRLWHEGLLPHLPRQQLLGQHRECCALRGLGWGRPHSTINYVFDHPYEWLWVYHLRVMKEMLNRGYQPDPRWYYMTYRGERAPTIIYYPLDNVDIVPAEHELFPQGWYKLNPDISLLQKAKDPAPIYPEHNYEYLLECLENLSHKGIETPI